MVCCGHGMPCPYGYEWDGRRAIPDKTLCAAVALCLCVRHLCSVGGTNTRIAPTICARATPAYV
ncbi:MAG: hypothetical protein OHK0046_52150 [Anaerolineae bacterium]